MTRKILIVSIYLLFSFALIGLIVYETKPILIKWCLGTARSIGSPIDATLYTNGRLNKNGYVYRINHYWNGAPANGFLRFTEGLHRKRTQRCSVLLLQLTNPW